MSTLDKIKLACNYYTIVSCIERSENGLDEFTMNCVKMIATSQIKVEREFYMEEPAELEETPNNYILHIIIGKLSHKITQYCKLTIPKSMIL